jgi:hypothetical protein
VKLTDPNPSLIARIADGQVRRFTRGRDFDESVRSFRKRMSREASALGRPVRVVPDKLTPHKHAWVQVGDATVQAGDPCICGSSKVERVHRSWGRCAACGALLEITAHEEATEPEPEPLAKAPDMQGPLDTFSDVTLHRYRLNLDEEWCYGFGTDATGVIEALAVVFPLDDGTRVEDPERRGQWQYSLHRVPAAHIRPLLDAARFERGPRVSWICKEDQGPEPEDDADSMIE